MRLKGNRRKAIIDKHPKEKEMVNKTYTETYGDELHSITTGGIIEGTRPRGRPRTKYISQIIKDAGGSPLTTYRELKDMANDREKRGRQLL